MDINKLHELFLKLKSITQIEDIAYLKIENKNVFAYYKLESGRLSNAQWKEDHSKMPITVDDNMILKSIFHHHKTFYMNNIETTINPPKEFEFFKIKTILLIPVIKDNIAIGFVDIASLEKPAELSIEQIKECEAQVSEFCKLL